VNTRPLIAAGAALGLGMGGFLDGIVFHQIFQLHNMLSNQYFPDSVVNLEINMFWDGIFHAFTWIVTALGIALLWNAARRPDVPWAKKTFFGSLILGWGVFNLTEGIINHQLLAIHHVVERATGLAQVFWDLVFLASGVLFITIGLTLIKGDHRRLSALTKRDAGGKAA
jgi:uncharacterized membrane protein